MKKLIISRNQLVQLCEDTTTLQFAVNDNSINNALSKGETQSKIQNAKSTFGNNVTAQFTPSDGPGDSTITVPNAIGGINGASEALKDNSAEVQKALSNGMNVGVDVTEMRKFSKKDIEEARLAKIRKDGRVMTKKELTESIVGK